MSAAYTIFTKIMPINIMLEGKVKPLVSIITPTFNRERFLFDTIQSVRCQTYENIEYIVIDDGSTDNTGALCEKFPDIKYVYQENSGQSSAINNGWSRASGKYLMYLSSDDLLKPDAVSNLVEYVEKYDECVVVYPNYDVINESGAHLRNVILGNFNESLFFSELVCVLGPGAMFSKSLFERHGGWRRNLRQVPDYEYWIRLSADARIINCPKILASSRVHSGAISYSKVSLKRSLEVVYVAKKYLMTEVIGADKYLLSKAYTTAMRYQLRTMQLVKAAMFVRKIWKINRRYLISKYFLRSVLAEIYHFAWR